MKNTDLSALREAPIDSEDGDPVFLQSDDAGQWINDEIGSVGGRRKQPNRRGRQSWIRRLVGLFVVLVTLGVFLAVVAGIVAYYKRESLIRMGEEAVLEDLKKQGIHVAYASADWEFPRGMILKDVQFFRTERQEQVLLKATDIGFNFDSVGTIRSRSLDDIKGLVTLRDASVTFYSEGQETARVEYLQADLLTSREQILVERCKGNFAGLDFDLEGEFLRGKDEARPPQEESEEVADSSGGDTWVPDFTFLSGLREWAAVQSENRAPMLEARFKSDQTGGEPLVIEGRLFGREFTWRKIPVESAAIDFVYLDSELMLELPEFQIVYSGGLLSGEVVFDGESGNLAINRFSSTADLIGLATTVRPDLAPRFDWIRMLDAPVIEASGNLDCNDFWNSRLQVDYTQWSGVLIRVGEDRQLSVRSIRGKVDLADGLLATEEFYATVFDGRFKFAGTAALNAEPTRIVGRLDAEGIPLQSIVEFSRGTGEMDGKLSGWFEGTGTTSLGGLEGEGSMLINEGNLYGVPVIGPIQNQFATVVPIFGDRPQNEASGTFAVRGGILASEDFEIASEGTKVQVNGELDLQKMETRFRAKGSLSAPLGVATDLSDEILEMEGSGPIGDLKLELDEVSAEWASESVRNVLNVAGESLGTLARDAAKANRGVAEYGGEPEGFSSAQDGARMIGDGLRSLIPETGRGYDGAAKTGPQAETIPEITIDPFLPPAAPN